MQKWEYLVLLIEDNRLSEFGTGALADYAESIQRLFGMSKRGESAQNTLNRLGPEGWEVVGMVGAPYAYTVMLKRPFA